MTVLCPSKHFKALLLFYDSILLYDLL